VSSLAHIPLEKCYEELRHKYLTILKSQYWEFFEEGLCTPESVIVLMEAADRSLDHEDQEMSDWKFIS